MCLKTRTRTSASSPATRNSYTTTGPGLLIGALAFILLISWAAPVLPIVPGAAYALRPLYSLRGTSVGATMSAPGGAGTLWRASCDILVLGSSASIMGSELSAYLTPALRFAAFPRPDAPGPSPSRTFLMYTPGGRSCLYIRNSLAGGPGPIGVRLSGVYTPACIFIQRHNM